MAVLCTGGCPKSKLQPLLVLFGQPSSGKLILLNYLSASNTCGIIIQIVFSVCAV